jgi:hypothetical protein
MLPLINGYAHGCDHPVSIHLVSRVVEKSYFINRDLFHEYIMSPKDADTITFEIGSEIGYIIDILDCLFARGYTVVEGMKMVMWERCECYKMDILTQHICDYGIGFICDKKGSEGWIEMETPRLFATIFDAPSGNMDYIKYLSSNVVKYLPSGWDERWDARGVLVHLLTTQSPFPSSIMPKFRFFSAISWDGLSGMVGGCTCERVRRLIALHTLRSLNMASNPERILMTRNIQPVVVKRDIILSSILQIFASESNLHHFIMEMRRRQFTTDILLILHLIPYFTPYLKYLLSETLASPIYTNSTMSDSSNPYHSLMYVHLQLELYRVFEEWMEGVLNRRH